MAPVAPVAFKLRLEFVIFFNYHRNNIVDACNMKYTLDKIKGIHPGLILERLLKNAAINQRQFALSINEHPQTLSSIIKGKRKINVELSLKLKKNYILTKVI